MFVPHPQHAAVALSGRRVHAGRSRQQRTTFTLYFAALSYSVRCPSSVVGVRSPSFALDFAGILSVNGKRCWSLWLVCLDKWVSERRIECMEAGSIQGGAAAVGADPFAAMAAQLTPKRAVSYIRVSTREQAQRGGSEEGFSLPAQREANKRKAQSMGALVIKEFADRGESARVPTGLSCRRCWPTLRKMVGLTMSSSIS